MEKLNKKLQEINEKAGKNLDEMSNILNNAYKEKTYERHDIENTPFSAIHETQENTYIITIGKNIMSEKKFKTLEETKKYINKKPYELLLNTMALMCENIFNYSQQKTEKHD